MEEGSERKVRRQKGKNEVVLKLISPDGNYWKTLDADVRAEKCRSLRPKSSGDSRKREAARMDQGPTR